MTALTVPTGRIPALLAAALDAGITPPSSVDVRAGAATGTVSWTPDLSAADQSTLAVIIQLAVGATLLTPAERTVIEPDIAGLRTYQGIASPTLAQTVAAVKAQSRVLRALLRDG